ncbi:MAG: hypothetical protein ACSLE2_11665 [Lysobacterales bacterium]
MLDERLARRHGLSIGDGISTFDYRMRMVGLSSGSVSPFTPYAFRQLRHAAESAAGIEPADRAGRLLAAVVSADQNESGRRRGAPARTSDCSAARCRFLHARLRQFGIHEVLGATPHQFAAALTAGSLIVAVVAIPAAMLLARVFAEVVARWNPLYSAGVWDPGVLGLALGLASAMVGGLLPLRLDPSLVFQR